MDPFPHHYTADATGATSGSVTVSSPGAPEIATETPEQYGGPGDQWSPETMLVAAVADCFVLSFRAVAWG